ncbi:MAG: hypothetical protein KDC38_20250 [Planctomycetes bacterium]|nr:hypothetical protein [Planctomycetota bacterium]
MNGIALSVYLGLRAVLPLQLGDTIESGLHPSARLAEAYGLIAGLDVRLADDRVARHGTWVGRPIVVEAESLDRLRLVLLGSGIYVFEVDRIGGEPYLFFTTDPSERPPLEVAYEVAMIQVRHLDPAELAAWLEKRVEEREKDLPPGALRTRFTADVRTGKIVARYTSRALLDEYRRLIATQDLPREPNDRPKLERWRSRSMLAGRLEPLLAARWKELGHAPLVIVVHAETNSLLIRAPRHLWPDVEALLEAIDPAP